MLNNDRKALILIGTIFETNNLTYKKQYHGIRNHRRKL